MNNFRDCAIAGLAVLLTIGLLELGLRASGRVFEPSLYEADPVLRVALRPNAEGWTGEEGENYLRINSLGMRDRERRLAADPGTLRIAMLGDSLVAAQQVPLAKTMTQTLERGLTQALAGSGRRAEVLNFGVGGYALSQMYLLLGQRVWAFHPNVVAVCVSQLTVPNSNRKTKSLADVPFFVLKDGNLVPDPENDPPPDTSEQQRHWHQVTGDLYNRVRVVQLLRTASQHASLDTAFAWSRKSTPVAAAPPPAPYMRVWPYRPPANPELANAWEVTEALLDRMIEETRKHGAEFWLIQIGNDIEEDPRDAERESFLRTNGLTDFDYATKRFAAFAARHDVPYVYLAPPMRDYAVKQGISLRGFFNTKPYQGHWNEAGNMIAARILEQEFMRNERLRSAPNAAAK